MILLSPVALAGVITAGLLVYLLANRFWSWAWQSLCQGGSTLAGAILTTLLLCAAGIGFSWLIVLATGGSWS